MDAQASAGATSAATTAQGLDTPAQPDRPLLSVVVPAYNERATIAQLLQRVLATPYAKEIIVVDDGSNDGTVEALRPFGIVAPGVRVPVACPNGIPCDVTLIVHDANRGKGVSVRDGIAACTGEIILIQDADLEYDPADYGKLLEPILDGRADVVYGSRFTGSPRRVLLFWHSLGNRLLTFISNMLTNLNLTDMETCYKVFRAEVIQGIPLRSQRFGIEPEITAKIARLRARIFEVPISYAGRSYLEGKKIGWRDGVAAVYTILKYAIVDDTAPVDDPGFLTLRRMQALHRYNAWLAELVEPFLGPTVLEVGAGIGNMTRVIARQHEVVATDVDPRYLDSLRRLFKNDGRVRIAHFDLDREPTGDTGGPFDSVVCLNVLEHIEDDVAALERMREQLRPGGRVVLIVPALQALYGELDRAIHHFRRYERPDIEARLRAAGFEIEHVSAFNALGVPGWFLNGRVLRRKSLPGVQARLNSLLVPLLRVERKLGLPWGLSLLAVGRRV